MRSMNHDQLNRWVGEQIHRQRTDQKISQERLAEMANVSRNFLSMLENGNKSAKIDTYYRISQALGVSLCELFYEKKADTSSEELLLLLDDCSALEIQVLINILRIVKAALHN